MDSTYIGYVVYIKHIVYLVYIVLYTVYVGYIVYIVSIVSIVYLVYLVYIGLSVYIVGIAAASGQLLGASWGPRGGLVMCQEHAMFTHVLRHF